GRPGFQAGLRGGPEKLDFRVGREGNRCSPYRALAGPGRRIFNAARHWRSPMLKKLRTIARSLRRRLPAIAAVLLLALPAVAAEDKAELYRAQTIVTGTGEANRLIGF